MTINRVMILQSIETNLILTLIESVPAPTVNNTNITDIDNTVKNRLDQYLNLVNSLLSVCHFFNARILATSLALINDELFPQFFLSWLITAAISSFDNCSPHAGIGVT